MDLNMSIYIKGIKVNYSNVGGGASMGAIQGDIMRYYYSGEFP